LGFGDWGWGIGDWGLGIGPNPQSPIPNPQSPIPIYIKYLYYILYKIKFIRFNYLLNLKINEIYKMSDSDNKINDFTRQAYLDSMKSRQANIDKFKTKSDPILQQNDYYVRKNI